AIATIITEVTLGAISYTYIHSKLYKIFTMPNILKFFKLVIAVTASAATAYFLMKINIYAATALSLVLFVGLIFILGLYSLKDREYIRKILKKEKV
ncbi:MAG: hypothetical protein ACD_63C00076G0008, partial [uncultured bacterium]